MGWQQNINHINHEPRQKSLRSSPCQSSSQRPYHGASDPLTSRPFTSKTSRLMSFLEAGPKRGGVFCCLDSFFWGVGLDWVWSWNAWCFLGEEYPYQTTIHTDRWWSRFVADIPSSYGSWLRQLHVSLGIDISMWHWHHWHHFRKLSCHTHINIINQSDLCECIPPLTESTRYLKVSIHFDDTWNEEIPSNVAS